MKPAHDTAADPNLDSRPGGTVFATNITAGYLIRLAYGVQDYQIDRAPGWMDSAHFDITAKGAPASPNASKGAALENEKAHIRALLADRFRFASHRETRQMRIYVLTIDKNGAKLKEHTDATGARSRSSCGHLAGTRLTADVLATMLSRQLETDVVNRTDLAGKYDFQLDWTPDSGPCPASADGASPSASSIFTALREQLGLRLESAKGPVEMLVIDHIERPSEN